MSATKKELIKKYVAAIREGNAAIFAGAGLSIDSGYVNWKGLLKPFAEHLKLDINKETDYLAVAQYYLNERANRNAVSQEILDAFGKDAKENKNIEIISRLPIYTYWTTNYDHLIEDGLEKAHRSADVKRESSQLIHSKRDRDAIVYKMHGDVDYPEEAVLTKDDYVLYDSQRPMFKTVLKGDLISKLFLFIGFSFEDPNLEYVLNQIHALMDGKVREHYCFLRRVQKADYKKDEDYIYDKAKQALKAKDLARYGIQTVFIDNYEEITDVLLLIEAAVKHRNVFISGSVAEYGTWSTEDAEKLAYELGKKLVKADFKVTSGFGSGIGSSVINGVLNGVYKSKYKHTNEHLCLRPFPQGIKDDAEREKLYTQYRKDMISDTGVAVFIFGNKEDSSDKKTIINAPGCREEFEIAKANGNILIPIGVTGYMAKDIFDEMRADAVSYPYLEGYWDVLEKETDIAKLVDTVIEIIRKSSSC